MNRTQKEKGNENCKNWEDFLGKLERLREEHRQRESSQQPPPFTPLLFRGQENSCWQLETTLERNGQRGMLLTEYYRKIHSIKLQIECFTGVNWEVPDLSEAEELLRTDPFYLPPDSKKRLLSLLRYMVYLRHFGFPSPFLDWTRSPYIAAFFAFRRAVKGAEQASVFVYRKAPGGRSTNSRIEAWGPPVGTHRRHFLQQCWYTICKDNELRLSSHEDAVARGDPQQDVVSKFNIPSRERITILKLLDNDYNLNAFSLFGSEESLMETMASQALDFCESNS